MTGNQKAASGPAIRTTRSLAKATQPRRASILWANRPAMRKKAVMRDRWMAKNSQAAPIDRLSSATIQICCGKKDRLA